ncbi:hypothetical protein GQ602_000788 [Ophiocordyceps camponoti-floridani]|uniref:Sulfatase-modifying factor enzyme domain-containing protein n=1 Tax=Ophiocordyceps camponoti-floridani TaxID=2030778 RepID=A0A8H4QCS7_9HYPO|nr:hypothetical protein GQ602_000788 [Ophiocordyceps camponoti-floridani]
MSDKPNDYAFPLQVLEYAAEPVPCIEEWRTLWKAWDLVTNMIPAEALMEQPIPLRNPLKFYVGHIPTFEDIHLARATGKPLTDPASYAQYFERGIDPDVDDPSQCHDHSELPTVWPDLGEMLDYREKVKARIRSMYETGLAYRDRCVGRALWIGYEHEALHLETFLYMAILSPNIQPPPGIPRPDFERMAREAASARVENEWFRIPDQELTLGYEDGESDDGPNRFFAWDNEREPYDVLVPSFEAQARPICVGEFAAFLVAVGRRDSIPATWVRTGSGGQGDDLQAFVSQHGIRTVWGLIPLSYAVDWPAMASYNEMSSYCDWLGGGVRIPTLEEVRSIHELVDRRKPSYKPSNNSKKNKTTHTDPETIFTDLTGANVGLQNFHPVSVTDRGASLCGLGDLGADFMDGKHVAITGGSWALPPRIAGRKTFQNWWQKGYAYPWVTARLVRDSPSPSRWPGAGFATQRTGKPAHGQFVRLRNSSAGTSLA